MNEQDIYLALQEYIQREFPNQGSELSATTDLVNDWFVDSLGIVETVIFIEQTFRIEVGRADINAQNFENLNSLTRFIATRLSG